MGKVHRYHALDGLRGWASLAVMISHFWLFARDLPVLDGYVLHNLSWLTLTPLGVFLQGRPAVLLFFVLSGFALTHMMGRYQGQYRSYVIARVARIWVPYALVLTLGVTLIWVLGWPNPAHLGAWSRSVTGAEFSWVHFAEHLTLIGNFTPIYMFVAWSLVHEMRVSLIFPYLLADIDRLGPLKSALRYVSISFAALVAFYAAKLLKWHEIEQLAATGHYLVFFVAGVLLAKQLDQVREVYLRWGGAQKVVSGVVAGVLYLYPFQLDGFFKSFNFPILLADWMALPGVLILVAMALVEPRCERFLSQPISAWLGQTSYSLYLVHPFLLFMSMHFFGQTGQLWATLFLGAAGSLLVAWACQRWVEVPSQNWGKRWTVPVSN